MSTPPDFNEALRQLVTAIVAETLPIVVGDLLARREDETIDAARFAADGLGTARQYADAARLGAFPTFRGGATGRARVAKRSDVVAWLATRTTRRKPRVTAAHAAHADSFADAYDAIARRAG